MKLSALNFWVAFVMIDGVSRAANASPTSHIKEDIFGVLADPDSPGGQTAVRRFTLSNSLGASVQVIEYGATVTSFKVIDNTGTVKDILLGFSDIDGYLSADNPYFGATVGRVANRIAGASFTLNNTTYNLTANEGCNQLHGGFKGFDKHVWESHVEGEKVTFTYLSRDGEEGYPGDLIASVAYELTADNELHVSYQATATKSTPVGLTSHSYFNLEGHDNADNQLREHYILINADRYTPVDDRLIPTGELKDVSGTLFDLRTNKNLRDQLLQFPPGNTTGYDHNFCINGNTGEALRLAARVHAKTTGIVLEVHTDQPGVQFYTANFLPETDPLIGKEGARYYRHGAFCLETQNYPNAVNTPSFPNSVLHPGEVYMHHLVYKFFNVAS